MMWSRYSMHPFRRTVRSKPRGGAWVNLRPSNRLPSPPCSGLSLLAYLLTPCLRVGENKLWYTLISYLTTEYSVVTICQIR